MQLKLRLLDLRKENKLLQRELAEILKVAQQTYARYEQGSAEPPIATFVYLASFYGTSVDYLLGLTSVRTPYGRE
ncbi:MAG: helix-turn-helix domain-containing protein [Oscillospiraceae bacterium]|nr:helix-turn-helix domain-containing protein [Oscillospiraceae bacterium]